MSDAAKVGIGVAAGSLGLAGAKQLLESQGPGGIGRKLQRTLPAGTAGRGRTGPE